MSKQQTGRIWQWGLLSAVFAGLVAYLIIFEPEPRVEKPFVTKNLKTNGSQVSGFKGPETADEQSRSSSTGKAQEASARNSMEPENYCTEVEKQVSEFFRYLDSCGYVKAMDLQAGSYARFKHVLKKLSAQPPIPAGERVDSKIIIGNLYHFYRILKRKDLRLIREIMAKEQDSLEVNMELFYRWLTLGKSCPDPEGLRPPKEILYHYAGFFLNTTGGRAYLFRRNTGVRLLVSYYCLLILHSADQKGANNYGIDVLPFIKTLKKEISIYPDFLFGDDYIGMLNRMEAYYSERR